MATSKDVDDIEEIIDYDKLKEEIENQLKNPPVKKQKEKEIEEEKEKNINKRKILRQFLQALPLQLKIN